MILQALKEYYDRKAADSESDIAPEGFERKEIPFVVVIKPDGEFVNLEDTRELTGTRLIGKPYLLPRSKTRTGSKSYETVFLLWDHIGYLFEYSKTDDAHDQKKATNQHKSWIKFINELPEEVKKDEGVAAVLLFYEINQIEKVKAHEKWSECIRIPSCNVTFRLVNDKVPVPCRSKVQEYVKSAADAVPEIENDSSIENISGTCLLTGEYGPIARTHNRTSINKDTKSLVAFQKNSGYDSYGKEQCYNAPVSKSAEFAYTTALNTLLKSKNQRMLVGDAVTVFWADRNTQLETDLNMFFNEPPKDDPDRNARAVKSLLVAVQNGSFIKTDSDNRFYVLGLAPNSARIAVRFWHNGTVPEMAGRFASHFIDTSIIHGAKEPESLPLYRLLVSTATQGKSENIPPNLAGETMRAILEGLPYPQTLLQAAIRRVRSEQAKKDRNSGKTLPNVTYERAAIIKACLNRYARFYNTKEEELKMSLDKENKNIGYRLGRLFAVMEKIQTRKFTQNGGKEPNSTIKDKYYGAASSTPSTVFSTLIRLSNYHLTGLENRGERTNLEKLKTEIFDGFCDFPHHLNLQEQGRFAIGYYHQKQDFFTKKNNEQSTQKGEVA